MLPCPSPNLHPRLDPFLPSPFTLFLTWQQKPTNQNPLSHLQDTETLDLKAGTYNTLPSKFDKVRGTEPCSVLYCVALGI